MHHGRPYPPIAVADAGTFTQAAEQIFIAQPTLSQQIRRLEEMVGTPLLQRRRDGVRLTAPVLWTGIAILRARYRAPGP